jgi:protein-disulfide isomerase
VQADSIRTLQSASGFHSFVEGHGPFHITAYFDPNCSACHEWWTSLHNTPNWVSKYTITWVPLGFLKPSSKGKAARILQDGVAGLTADETGFNMAKEEGAAIPLTTPALVAEIKANTHNWALLDKNIGIESATPTLVFGQGHVIVGGMPLSLIDRIASVKGNVVIQRFVPATKPPHSVAPTPITGAPTKPVSAAPGAVAATP